MRHLAWVLFVVSVVAACGGSVASAPDGASSSGGSSGSSGTSSGSTDETCSAISVDGSRVCVPGAASANQPIVVEMDDPQGCLPCRTTIDRCSVAVTANVITVTMEATHCAGGSTVCPGACGIPSAKCTIPPLAPGKYTVELAGEGGRTGLVPRELVVTTGASAMSCALTMPANGNLDGTTFSTSCSNDDDCRPATFGNLCQPCKCPNGAIANAATDAYEADLRAASSQCPSPRDGIVCAACPPMKARCEVKSDALTGTCKLDMQ